MKLRLADVLADPDLGLRLVDGEPAALNQPVRWCAVTELADPRPFLSGGELVLTTGLSQTEPAAQRQFVQRVAERRASGLGFGIGLTHSLIPDATIAAARQARLPVIEIPYATPFIAVDRFVADRVLEEQYGRFADLLDEHDTLAKALLSGRGLGALIESLHQILGAPAMVLDLYGRVLATAPAGAAWPVEQILSAARAKATGESPTAIPVSVEDTVVAYLCCRRPRRSADVLPYAVSLVGLELARRQAELAGKRRLAGQVLEDLVRGTIGAPEASRRLAPFGIRPDDEHALVVAAASSPQGLLSSPPLAGATTAVFDDCLIAVLEPGRPAREAARQLHAHLGRHGGEVRVGIGGWYTGMNGLRWSYYEAYEAMTRGPGINEREQMSLSGLLLASEDVPLRDLARDVLRPLRDFDAAHAGSLLATLRAYLDADGSVATVADRLIVHRNTVRYRLEQIERLTGRSLARTADRVQLWLAVAAARFDT
ncbi:PucR family transcriptional regulator ligand-binding domain-containing protein [Actinoplanes sp. LDG1-06]|uniref:PucR family transcriptional regulator ligand-binding domain-containing protein n=1 Tax=Paractinoplanes ovalisporus TaxID=2810368 RepID=A0ABS2AUZ8_9ACTN|nr:PucR family transcriptional regulator [Actinoplanes ovalisporus]MBM2623675.1 PucR family transcriptional regulator ligand-binding domain-containing protein [Actinoplanes ovalisporus]